MKRIATTLAAAALALAVVPAAFAQATGNPIDAQVVALDKTANNRGQALVATKIASNFTSLAGSEENALALVNALRTGEAVKLTYPPTGTATTPTIATIDPPTGNMGWGNVKIALALAQAQLTQLGITNPTAEQLQAALNGGTVTVTNANGTTTTTTLRGVLQMRVDGMGWGEIAQAGGTKVGPVVSQLKMANAKVATIPVSTKSAAANAVATTGAAKVTTAAGTGGAKGLTTASGAANSAASHGLTTAEGAITTQKGNAYGRGVVTASGGSATNTASLHGKPATAGAGVVTAAGGSAANGVTTAHGNGKGNGGDNGKGKGG